MISELSLKQKHALLLLATLLISVLSISGFQIDEWRATHWLMSYEFEFVKRGFLGELLGNLGVINPTLELLTTLSLSIYFVLFLSLIYFFYSSFREIPFLAFIFICAGFCIQQFGYDAGRFDQPILILTIISLITLIKFDITWLTLGAITLLSCVSLLIHEGSALIAIPLVFSALAIKTLEEEKPLAYGITYLFVCVMAFGLISINGGLTSISSGIWMEHLQTKAQGFEVDFNSGIVPFSSLPDNIKMTLDRLFQNQSISRFALVTFVSIPYVVLITKLISGFEFKHVLSKYLCYLPALSILPLFALGLDFYRWVAIILLNLSLLIAFNFTYTKNNYRPKKLLSSLLVLFLLYSGPYGISTALVERGMVFKQIQSLVKS